MVGRNILENKNCSNHNILSPSSDELNLLNYDEVFNYIKNKKPEIIIHAAGIVGGIQANIANPISFLLDNLTMGKNIVLAAKNNNIKKLLNLGTSCMYPRDASNPLKEEYILKGQLEPTNEGYALSKVVVSKLCEYVSNQNKDFLFKTVIPCNLYGKYDKFSPENSHMLPAVIKKIHEAKTHDYENVEIWGDGLARREFMYAADLSDFIFEALNNFEKLPQNINVGYGEDYTINDYYKTVAEVIGYTGGFSHDLSKPTGMKQKLMDNKLVKEFGWKPKTDLFSGIKSTYNFYKKYQI